MMIFIENLQNLKSKVSLYDNTQLFSNSKINIFQIADCEIIKIDEYFPDSVSKPRHSFLRAYYFCDYYGPCDTVTHVLSRSIISCVFL